MPKETSAKTPNRWEGTQTYTRGNPTRSRPRTAAQVRDEAAARLKADREKRRIEVEKIRRNSIASFPTREDVEAPEEIFFDAATSTEEMPGSNKKKRAASGATSPPQSTPMEEEPTAPGVDPAMLALLMSIKKDINDTTKEAVSKIDKRIDDNARAIKLVGENTTAEIKKLTAHVEETQAGLEAKIKKQFQEREGTLERRLTALEARTTSMTPTTSSPSPRQEEAYHRARKTLKVWPVAGADLPDALKTFMRNKLKIDDEKINAFGALSVKPSMGRTARDKSEVLATFETRDDRDYVKSMGVNLANQTGVGMAIHVPGHLLDNYYALSSIGYNIKQNHDGVRRAIKFDDAVQDVYLDIFVSGQWKRILPREARAALKKTPNIGGASGRSIMAADLVNLVQGKPLDQSIVEVPADGQEKQKE